MDGAVSETLHARCTASTAGSSNPPSEASIFKTALWSPDGTCVITNSFDNALRTFVLPPDLLDERASPHILEPYSVLQNPESIYSTAIYPHYKLDDLTTTLVLSSLKDHPIRLSNAIYPTLLASYPHVNPNTEDFITPHSLLFSRDGTKFVSGSDSLLAVFDLNKCGDGPIERHFTIPSKRKKIVGGGVGMKGIVSALSSSCEGLLAAGTFTRSIGLYGDEGRGTFAGVFSLVGEDEGIGGSGVTQTLWSPCGRYLYIAERMSDGLLAYDIRVAGKRLSVLTGRKAMTQQRMSVDVVTTDSGHELWAGGMDGHVRVWENPHLNEGAQGESMSLKAHDDSVSSVQVHPNGSVAATCSGQRKDDATDSPIANMDSEKSEQGDDFSLKIWSLT